MSCSPTIKKDLKDITYEELVSYLKENDEKAFRSNQIFDWIYKKNIDRFDQMKNVAPTLLRKLSSHFNFFHFHSSQKLASKDGTIKFLFEVDPGQYIETVLIPAKGRLTLCVSTQIGCKFKCFFCASGKNGLMRNLTCGEIVSQILCAQKESGLGKITHIVFMGVGEPFDNYDNVLKAIRIINDPKAFGIAARKITVSTCGIIPKIKEFSTCGMQIELAISLHGSNSQIRSQLMPVNKRYPLENLLETACEYSKKTNRQITFEYVLIKDFNASMKHARELAKLLKGMLCKVNLIAYNHADVSRCSSVTRKDIAFFKSALEEKGIVVTIRMPRGEDIDAACGQLRYRHTKKRKIQS